MRDIGSSWRVAKKVAAWRSVLKEGYRIDFPIAAVRSHAASRGDGRAVAWAPDVATQCLNEVLNAA